MPPLSPDAATLRRDRVSQAPATLDVRVTAGPDAGASLTIAIDATTLTVIGTGTSSALRLTDPHVSRRHLAIVGSERGVSIRDLGTTNGTSVRGVRVGEAFLEPGEAVLIGDTTLAIHWTLSHAATLPDEADRFGRMIGKGPAMRRLFALAERLAGSEISVLVEGETGTGKELLAEQLHACGPRRDRALVVFDAIEDEPQHATLALFGAAAGVYPAFPEGRAGLLELAHGGTLLLDEPSELTPELQRRLARALARRESRRAGSEEPHALDVRVIATSSLDLERRVEDGLFREDLFHLLAAARLELPPLRQRSEDIVALTRHFWSSSGARGEPSQPLLDRFVEQAWPGNVRELENAVARHLVTGELDARARSRAAPPSVPPPAGDDFAAVLARRLPLAQARHEVIAAFERRYVEQILREHGGNVTHAARASGLAHRYFQALKARRTG